MVCSWGRASPKLAQNPVYYAVPEQSREEIFNQWVLERTSTEEKSAGFSQLRKFVSSTFSSPTRAKYASGILLNFSVIMPKNWKTQISGHQFEDAYRRLRLTLNDFAEYERRVKTRDRKVKCQGRACATVCRETSPPASLQRGQRHFAPESLQQAWRLLNSGSTFAMCQVPLKVANDPTNFIVGDEKRIACYIAALESEDSLITSHWRLARLRAYVHPTWCDNSVGQNTAAT